MKPGFFISKSRRKRLTYDEKISMLKNHVSMETILQSRSSFDFYLHKVKSQQMEKHVQRLHKLHRRQRGRLTDLKAVAYKSLNENTEMIASQDRPLLRDARKQCMFDTDDGSVMSSVDVSRLTIHDKASEERNVQNLSKDELPETFSTQKQQKEENNINEDDNLVVRFSESDDLKPERSDRQESPIFEFPKTIRKRKAYVPRKYQGSSASGDVTAEKHQVSTASPDVQPFQKKSKGPLKSGTSRGCQTYMAGPQQTSTINTWSLYKSFQQFMKSKNRSKGIFTVSGFTETRDVRKVSGSETIEKIRYGNCGNSEVNRDANDLSQSDGHLSIFKADSMIPNLLHYSSNKCNDNESTPKNNVFKLLPISTLNYQTNDGQCSSDKRLPDVKESDVGVSLPVASSVHEPQSVQLQSTKSRKVDMYLYLPPKCFNQPDLITVVKLSSTEKKQA